MRITQEYRIPITEEVQFKYKVIRRANRTHAKDSKRYFVDFDSALKYIKRRSYNDLDDFVYYELHEIYTNRKECARYKYVYQHRQYVGIESHHCLPCMVWDWF